MTFFQPCPQIFNRRCRNKKPEKAAHRYLSTSSERAIGDPKWPARGEPVMGGWWWAVCTLMQSQSVFTYIYKKSTKNCSLKNNQKKPKTHTPSAHATSYQVFLPFFFLSVLSIFIPFIFIVRHLQILKWFRLSLYNCASSTFFEGNLK